MANPFDPPSDYAPPVDFVEPNLAAAPFVEDPTEVGALLRARAERNGHVDEPVEFHVAEAHEDPCVDCAAKARRAQLIGVAAGAVSTAMILTGLWAAFVRGRDE